MSSCDVAQEQRKRSTTPGNASAAGAVAPPQTRKIQKKTKEQGVTGSRRPDTIPAPEMPHTLVGKGHRRIESADALRCCNSFGWEVVYVARKADSSGGAHHNHDRYFVHPGGQVFRSFHEATKGVPETALSALEALAARAKGELIRFREAKIAAATHSSRRPPTSKLQRPRERLSKPHKNGSGKSSLEPQNWEGGIEVDDVLLESTGRKGMAESCNRRNHKKGCQCHVRGAITLAMSTTNSGPEKRKRLKAATDTEIGPGLMVQQSADPRSRPMPQSALSQPVTSVSREVVLDVPGSSTATQSAGDAEFNGSLSAPSDGMTRIENQKMAFEPEEQMLETGMRSTLSSAAEDTGCEKSLFEI